MSRPAVFFDRDNTLIANGEYLGDPDRVVLLTGAAEAVARVRAMGFATVVVSNQSGVARGMFSEDDVRAVNARMDKALLDLNPEALIERHEFCPYHPEAKSAAYRGDHARRKPKPGMLLDAAEAMDLDLPRSWLIGDAPRDVEAGHRAGCRTILIRDPLLAHIASPAAGERTAVEADYVATSLMDAVDFIEMQFEAGNDLAGSPKPLIDSSDAEPVEDVVPDPADAAEGSPAAPSHSPFAAEPAALGSTGDAEPAPVAAQATAAAITSDAITPVYSIPLPQPSSNVSVSLAESRPPASAPSWSDAPSAEREQVLLLERVVEELRRANDPPQDFSVARMLAGIIQGFALAALFGALLYRDTPATFQTLMLLAIFLQAMVSSLVLMGR